MATKVVVSFEVDNAGAVTKIQQVRKELGEVPQTAERAASGFLSLRNALVAVAGSFAAIKIGNFLRESIQGAIEEEEVMSRLAATLATLGVQYSSVSVELEGMFKRIQDTTRFSDDEAAAAFQKLTVITGNYSSAMRLLGPVLDMAVGGTMDLGTAAELAGKAATGYTGILSRYGIVLDDATKKQLQHADAAERTEIIAKALSDRFGGQAQADVQTYAGQIARLKNHWDDLKEALGAAILESVDLGGAIQSVIEELKRLQESGAISKIGETIGAIASALPEVLRGAKILAGVLATMWVIEKVSEFSDLLDRMPGRFRLANAAALDLKFTIAAIVGIGLSQWFDSWNRTLEGPSARAIGSFQRAVKDAGMSIDGLLASFPEARDKTEAWTLAFERFIADTKDGTAATGQWVRVAALYNAEMGTAADVTVSATSKIVEGVGMSTEEIEKFEDALKKLTGDVMGALFREANELYAYNDNVIDEIIGRWRERYPVEFPDVILDAVEATGPVYQEMADNSYEILSDSFSDLLGKGFMGELDSFADLWDEIWQDLAKSMVGIIGDAFDELLSGTGGWGGVLQTMGQKIGAMVGGLGMMISGAQQGGAGGILQGALGGGMMGFAIGSMFTTWGGAMAAGASLGPVGMIAGAIIGGVIAALASGSDDPETYVRNLGLDTGYISTRGHQGYSTELRELWIKQQQSIMRSYIQSYRSLLSLFGDRGLFELIGATPTFDSSGWMGLGADSLAQWLQKEYWPSAFMEMFQSAISEGLSGFGVTSGTLNQLWTELEALPGEERMGALTTYVSSLINLSNLMKDMDWNAIMDAVGMDSMQVFMSGIEQIAGSIETLMFALDDMTLLERAEQAAQIEDLIVQVRQAEIQYLQQLDSLQKSINASIASQIEQLQLSDMGGTQQRSYYQQRIAEIMAELAGGGVTSPEQLQQLMADLQRYIQALAQGLGDQLFDPMDVMGWGETWVDYLTGILQEAQGYSDAYFEQFRDEIRAANDELIDAIRDLIDALTDAKPGLGGDTGTGALPEENLMWYSPGGGQPQVNVYLDGSMAALRPFVRAEIRDSLSGRPRGIN